MSDELSEEAILELEGALARASPSPWTVHQEHKYGPGSTRDKVNWIPDPDSSYIAAEMDMPPVAEDVQNADAAAIAALRNATPSLLSEIRQAGLFRKEARTLLELCLSWFAEEADHGQGDAWLMRDRLVAFLGERSDRERSEPTDVPKPGKVQ